MPYYIRHREISRKIGVFIVWADDETEALAKTLSLREKAYIGYYTAEDNVFSDENKIVGPFETRREAEEKRPEAWIEDI
jgi:hypothetical protein